MLEDLILTLQKEANLISGERKVLLHSLADAIRTSLNTFGSCNIIAVCTHNSRRSQLAEAWIHVMSRHLQLPAIKAYSGGTESTAFYPLMIQAMKNCGFALNISVEGDNPTMKLELGEKEVPHLMFSKKFDHSSNPDKNFIALMVCSDADENCPFIPGAFRRISLTFEDPKMYDGQPDALDRYQEKVHEIGREIIYAMGQL